jgi:tetratricopeptide (TPR) repeat protein
MREAWEATNALLDLDPTNQRVLQQRVEYAAASGDLELGLQSYLEFGRFLQRTGAEGKARVIFQRVLDLDPHNAEASAFMKAAAPPKVTTGYVDLLALLGDEDEQAENTRFMVAEKPPTGDEERDFADMLAQFKQKVAENVSLSESGAHYDLGLAFKEMGLIDEAIAEFQVALKGGEERLKVYEELGQCFLAKQQYTVAVTVLNRALTLPVKDDSDLLGVYYSLGRSYEELGRPAEARSAYERVVGFDIGFRDAAERLARL